MHGPCSAARGPTSGALKFRSWFLYLFFGDLDVYGLGFRGLWGRTFAAYRGLVDVDAKDFFAGAPQSPGEPRHANHEHAAARSDRDPLHLGEAQGSLIFTGIPLFVGLLSLKNSEVLAEVTYSFRQVTVLSVRAIFAVHCRLVQILMLWTFLRCHDLSRHNQQQKLTLTVRFN